ncbi:MAG: flagellar biosynthetic protein FliO [Candidatus Auribacterota bacterium]
MRNVFSCMVIILLVWVFYTPYTVIAQNNETPTVQSEQVSGEGSFLADSDYSPVQPIPTPNLKHLLARVILSLGLIIACIIGIIYLLRYVLRDKQSLFSKRERYFEVIDRLHLDQKKSVYLIKLIDEVLVLGGTPESLSLLDKITDQEKVVALASRDFMPLLDLFHKQVEKTEHQAVRS